MASAPGRPPILSWRSAAAALQGLFYLGYPLVIYAAHARLETRRVAGILLALYGLAMLLRLRGSRSDLWHVLRQYLPLIALTAAAIVLGNRTLLLLLPMLVSLYLFAIFAWSLRRGPPMIERFARLAEDDLPEFTLPYCRKVTEVWCAFLAANAAAVLVLALGAPISWWALYTGALAYLLMILLLAGEFVFRKLWFRHYGDGVADRLLGRWFPPERTANGRRSLAYVARRQARAAAGRGAALQDPPARPATASSRQ
jgi:uncharacterized membrane protein